MLPLILYITAMRYFSLLSNKVNLYQTMNLKCNNGSLHGLLSSVFNVSMAINRLATNFGQVLPRDVHFYESMENIKDLYVKIHILLQIFHIAQIIFDLQMQIDV